MALMVNLSLKKNRFVKIKFSENTLTVEAIDDSQTSNRYEWYHSFSFK